MRSLREIYDLPDRPPVAVRQWLLMLAIPALALVLWLVLPDTAVVVGLIALVLLVAVFAGVYRVLTARELRSRPGRRPTTPPSRQGP